MVWFSLRVGVFWTPQSLSNSLREAPRSSRGKTPFLRFQRLQEALQTSQKLGIRSDTSLVHLGSFWPYVVMLWLPTCLFLTKTRPSTAWTTFKHHIRALSSLEVHSDFPQRLSALWSGLLTVLGLCVDDSIFWLELHATKAKNTQAYHTHTCKYKHSLSIFQYLSTG